MRYDKPAEAPAETAAETATSKQKRKLQEAFGDIDLESEEVLCLSAVVGDQSGAGQEAAEARLEPRRTGR